MATSLFATGPGFELKKLPDPATMLDFPQQTLPSATAPGLVQTVAPVVLPPNVESSTPKAIIQPYVAPTSTPSAVVQPTKVTAPVAGVVTSAAPKPVDVSGMKLLGPTEYGNIIRENKVGSANFDQYFVKQGDNIYLKPTATVSGANPSVSVPGKEQNIDVTKAGATATVPGGNQTPATASTVQTNGVDRYAELDATIKQLGDTHTKTVADLNKQYQDSLDNAAKGIGAVLDFNSPQYLKQLQDAEGLAQKESDLTMIKNQIADVNSRFATASLAAENEPIPLSFIRGRQAQINAAQAAEVAALSAKADIVSGQIDRANSRVNAFYLAKQDDNKNALTKYQVMMDLVDKGIVRMDAAEKDSFDLQKSVLAEQAARIDKDRSAALQLMNTYPDAFAKAQVTFDMPMDEIAQKVGEARAQTESGKAMTDVISALSVQYADAGLTMTDTPEQVRAKISKSAKYQSEIAATNRSNRGGGGGGGTATANKQTVANVQATLDNIALAAGQGTPIPDWAKPYIVKNTDTQKIEAYKVTLGNVDGILQAASPGTAVVSPQTKLTEAAEVTKVANSIKDLLAAGKGYTQIRKELKVDVNPDGTPNDSRWRAALDEYLNGIYGKNNGILGKNPSPLTGVARTITSPIVEAGKQTKNIVSGVGNIVGGAVKGY